MNGTYAGRGIALFKYTAAAARALQTTLLPSWWAMSPA